MEQCFYWVYLFVCAFYWVVLSFVPEQYAEKTALRISEYLIAKASSLSMLSLIAAWAIHWPAVGVPKSPLAFSAGVVLTSSLMTFISIGVVARCKTINGFILKSQAFALPFTIPLLGLFDGWHHPLFLILPTEGSMVLLESAFRKLTLPEWTYAFFILAIWNFAAFRFARFAYGRYMLGRIETK